MFTRPILRSMIRPYAAVLTALLLTTGAWAADSPQTVWVKAKCALCHGTDGSSQTEHGKKLHAPDLRAPATQKQTDEMLAKEISAGHERMPSFDATNAETVRVLVACIREFGKAQVARK
jgi:mono/diheme cytochrome c family protein